MLWAVARALLLLVVFSLLLCICLGVVGGCQGVVVIVVTSCF